jgi:hypothetical protein
MRAIDANIVCSLEPISDKNFEKFMGHIFINLFSNAPKKLGDIVSDM